MSATQIQVDIVAQGTTKRFEIHFHLTKSVQRNSFVEKCAVQLLRWKVCSAIVCWKVCSAIICWKVCSTVIRWKVCSAILLAKSVQRNCLVKSVQCWLLINHQPDPSSDWLARPVARLIGPTHHQIDWPGLSPDWLAQPVTRLISPTRHWND